MLTSETGTLYHTGDFLSRGMHRVPEEWQQSKARVSVSWALMTESNGRARKDCRVVCYQRLGTWSHKGSCCVVNDLGISIATELIILGHPEKDVCSMKRRQQRLPGLSSANVSPWFDHWFYEF